MLANSRKTHEDYLQMDTSWIEATTNTNQKQSVKYYLVFNAIAIGIPVMRYTDDCKHHQQQEIDQRYAKHQVQDDLVAHCGLARKVACFLILEQMTTLGQ
jgi:cobalamin biosynthesis Co2+ chelatase CbiK